MSDQFTHTIEIRPERPDDGPALTRLGQLDSACVPPAPLLLGVEGGQLRAAISLATGEAIADPFVPTARLVELLRTQAAPPRQRSSERSRFPFIRRSVPAWQLEPVER